LDEDLLEYTAMLLSLGVAESNTQRYEDVYKIAREGFEAMDLKLIPDDLHHETRMGRAETRVLLGWMLKARKSQDCAAKTCEEWLTKIRMTMSLRLGFAEIDLSKVLSKRLVVGYSKISNSKPVEKMPIKPEHALFLD